MKSKLDKTKLVDATESRWFSARRPLRSIVSFNLLLVFQIPVCSTSLITSCCSYKSTSFSQTNKESCSMFFNKHLKNTQVFFLKTGSSISINMSVSNIPMHGILQSKFVLLNRAVWAFSESIGKQYFQNEYLAIDNPVHACIICSCCCFSFWLEAILSGNQKKVFLQQN